MFKDISREKGVEAFTSSLQQLNITEEALPAFITRMNDGFAFMETYDGCVTVALKPVLWNDEDDWLEVHFCSVEDISVFKKMKYIMGMSDRLKEVNVVTSVSEFYDTLPLLLTKRMGFKRKGLVGQYRALDGCYYYTYYYERHKTPTNTPIT